VCGIVGYTGERFASRILLDSLSRLEYRGYDSSGIALLTPTNMQVIRARGKLQELTKKLEGEMTDARAGIGHTRWATHGMPSEKNAHPQLDPFGRVAIVHNGIIENWEDLRRQYGQGSFSSDTDTEVLAHMLVGGLDAGLDLVEAVQLILSKASGAYSFLAIDSQQPDRLVGARVGNAGGLVIGIGEDESVVASDLSALLPYSQEFIFLESDEIVDIRPTAVQVFSSDGDPKIRPPEKLSLDPVTAAKGTYKHFMLKEIHEQPETLLNGMRGRYSGSDETINLSSELRHERFSVENLKEINRCLIVGMGTSMHAAMIGRHYLEQFARIPTEVDNSAEFRYRRPLLDQNTLVISVTQSGETVDTLAAMEEAKRAGCPQITLSNSVGSQTTRLADSTMMLHAGPEIAVASTKTMIASVIALHGLSLFLGKQREMLQPETEQEQVRQALLLPAAVSNVLKVTDQIDKVAEKYAASNNFLFLGRGLGYPVALEGALKLKEVSYIHAEGYSAGEMKHGPIALIDDQMPTLAICTQGDVHDKMRSNIQQIRARGGSVIALVSEGDSSMDTIATDTLIVPDIDPILSPIPAIVALQLFSYGIATRRGADVDQPRNLAKTVTVE